MNTADALRSLSPPGNTLILRESVLFPALAYDSYSLGKWSVAWCFLGATFPAGVGVDSDCSTSRSCPCVLVIGQGVGTWLKLGPMRLSFRAIARTTKRKGLLHLRDTNLWFLTAGFLSAWGFSLPPKEAGKEGRDSKTTISKVPLI